VLPRLRHRLFVSTQEEKKKKKKISGQAHAHTHTHIQNIRTRTQARHHNPVLVRQINSVLFVCDYLFSFFLLLSTIAVKTTKAKGLHTLSGKSYIYIYNE